MKLIIYTVGHSTRSIDEFVGLLQTFKIELVIDVRRIAKSLHNPQFGEDALRESLEKHGIT